jgi:CHAD domain-containing protein
MNREQLISISSGHYRKLKKYFYQCRQNLQAEPVHQFRVEYKKLRAFTRMIKQGSREPVKIKISTKLKNIYKLLGAIRDLQLQQRRIYQMASPPAAKPLAYFDTLQKKIVKLQVRLHKKYSTVSFKKDKRKNIRAMPVDFTWNNFLVYVQAKRNDMHIVSQNGFEPDEHIHSMRKHLKDLNYNMVLYKGTAYEFLLVKMRKGRDEAYLNCLLEELGHFQDLCTAIDLLKPAWLRSLDDLSRRPLDLVKKQLLNDKEHLKKILSEKLEKDFSW